MAPFTGHLTIGGAIRRPSTAGADGVRASIYRTRTPPSPPNAPPVDTLLWTRTLDVGADPCTPDSGNGCGDGLTVEVAAGDRFYFKLDGVDDIEGDATDWSPSLSYVDTCAPPQPCQPVNHAARDVYGLPAFDFGRASDFRLADPQVPGFAASVVGTVKVTGRCDARRRPMA